MQLFETYKTEHNYVDLEPLLTTMRIYELNSHTLFVNMKKIEGTSIDNLLTYYQMIDEIVDNLYVLKNQIENDAISIATATQAYQTQAGRREYYKNMIDNLQFLYGSGHIEHHLKQSLKYPGMAGGGGSIQKGGQVVGTMYSLCLRYIYGKIEQACRKIEEALMDDFITEDTLKQIHKIYNGLESLVMVNIFSYSRNDNKQTPLMVHPSVFFFFS